MFVDINCPPTTALDRLNKFITSYVNKFVTRFPHVYTPGSTSRHQVINEDWLLNYKTVERMAVGVGGKAAHFLI